MSPLRKEIWHRRIFPEHWKMQEPVPFLWFRGQRAVRICRERWESLRSHMLRGQSFVTQVFVLRFSGALPGLESRN